MRVLKFGALLAAFSLGVGACAGSGGDEVSESVSPVEWDPLEWEPTVKIDPPDISEE